MDPLVNHKSLHQTVLGRLSLVRKEVVVWCIGFSLARSFSDRRSSRLLPTLTMYDKHLGPALGRLSMNGPSTNHLLSRTPQRMKKRNHILGASQKKKTVHCGLSWYTKVVGFIQQFRVHKFHSAAWRTWCNRFISTTEKVVVSGDVLPLGLTANANDQIILAPAFSFRSRFLE